MISLQRFTFFYFLCLIFIKSSAAQEIIIPAISADYFRDPLDIKLYLAGDFGEIRPNHFHSGIDIKTNQREGYPVYAVADGYVSRLRVQIGGFGNAIYINHPNGFTSVYGHLQKFNPRIAMMMKSMQYKDRSFTEDFMLAPIEIPVKKGELIAWSGNTGGSAGPHLHFELRDTRTEEAINALTLGIKVADHIKPSIHGFYIYQTNHQPFSENTAKKYYAVAGSNGNYHLNSTGVITVNGQIGLGIMAFDQQDGSANHNGLFSTTIKLDEAIIYETVISKFSFDNSRAVNAYIDYPSKITSGRVIQKGFAAPNPKVRFYKHLVNDGFIELADKEVHHVEYILKDVSGNTSVLKFSIRSNLKPLAGRTFTGQMFSYKTANDLENPEVKVHLPAGRLYDDLDFQYSSTAKPAYGYSKIQHIHNKLTPLHDVYDLSIKADSSLLPYQDKALIYHTEFGSQGGEFKDGYVTAKPKVFGNFYIRVDTIAPVIVPVNVREGVNLSKQSRMSFRISDNMSGIRSFDAYIDGQWVLMEYDYRNGSLWHTFDEKTGFGEHTFKLVVTDMKQNEKTYSIKFYR